MAECWSRRENVYWVLAEEDRHSELLERETLGEVWQVRQFLLGLRERASAESEEILKGILYPLSSYLQYRDSSSCT